MPPADGYKNVLLDPCRPYPILIARSVQPNGAQLTALPASVSCVKRPLQVGCITLRTVPPWLKGVIALVMYVCLLLLRSLVTLVMVTGESVPPRVRKRAVNSCVVHPVGRDVWAYRVRWVWTWNLG